MADLVAALDSLFDGGDMTIFQAVVDEIGSGVVTLHANGGQFEDVPFIEREVFSGAAYPSIGDHVYVIGRRGWGMLVIGRASPSDREPPTDSATSEFATAVIGDYNFATATWTVPLSDVMAITPSEGANKGAFYFHNLVGAVPVESIATASFYLGTGPFDTGGVATDYVYILLGLFSSTTATPSAPPQFVTGYEASYRVLANSSQEKYVSIPLSWATKLVTGDASGISVTSPDYPGVVHGPGTIRLTTL